MKILYLGTVCSSKDFEEIIRKSRFKPSAAPQTFETMFIDGLAKEDVELDLYSFPMIKTFPGSRFFCWGNHKKCIHDRFILKWLPAINLPVIKELCFRISSKIVIRRWLRKNSHEKSKCIIMYSIFDSVVKNVIQLSDRYGCKAVAIVPDLPKHMYANRKISGLKSYLAQFAVKNALRFQNKFDAYIYFTENMRQEFKTEVPSIVLEGMANPGEFDKVRTAEKQQDKKILMYAGALSEKYGIGKLIEAFMRIEDPDYILKIFGTGDFEEQIKLYAQKDPRIQFKGRVGREEVLQNELQADLLVNVRNPEDEFTRYSFPSKCMEYMASGTPFLTTKLPGMPSEYFDYVYTVDNYTVEGIEGALREVLSYSTDELEEKGRLAKQFIQEKKSYETRMREVFCFLKEIVSAPTAVQINCASYGSTGTLCRILHLDMQKNGVKSYFFYGYGKCALRNSYTISNWFDRRLHDKLSAITGLQGFFSVICTIRMLIKLKQINPDVVHLHNIHGNYVSYPILLKNLKNKSVILTLHDCWTFTGKCPHYSVAQCNKWKTGCKECSQLHSYPRSLFFDTSALAYKLKKKLFRDLTNLTIVTVSDWLKTQAEHSFLGGGIPIYRIYNGIDTHVFKPTENHFKEDYDIEDKFMVLGVSNVWSANKGLDDFIELRKRLDDKFALVIVGTEQKLDGIITIGRTEDQRQLAGIYTAADIFFSPSLEETFGLVTAEAIACGTAVIVYNATACPEIVCENNGFIVEPRNIDQVVKCINENYNKNLDVQFSNDIFSTEIMIDNYHKIYKLVLE